MKTALVILMVLRLALPGAVWAGLMTEPACARAAVVETAEKNPHCACCQPGSCSCSQPDGSTPANETPASPARSDLSHGWTGVP